MAEKTITQENLYIDTIDGLQKKLLLYPSCEGENEINNIEYLTFGALKSVKYSDIVPDKKYLKKDCGSIFQNDKLSYYGDGLLKSKTLVDKDDFIRTTYEYMRIPTYEELYQLLYNCESLSIDFGLINGNGEFTDYGDVVIKGGINSGGINKGIKIPFLPYYSTSIIEGDTNYIKYEEKGTHKKRVYSYTQEGSYFKTVSASSSFHYWSDIYLLTNTITSDCATALKIEITPTMVKATDKQYLYDTINPDVTNGDNSTPVYADYVWWYNKKEHKTYKWGYAWTPEKHGLNPEDWEIVYILDPTNVTYSISKVLLENNESCMVLPIYFEDIVDINITNGEVQLRERKFSELTQKANDSSANLFLEIFQKIPSINKGIIQPYTFNLSPTTTSFPLLLQLVGGQQISIELSTIIGYDDESVGGKLKLIFHSEYGYMCIDDSVKNLLYKNNGIVYFDTNKLFSENKNINFALTINIEYDIPQFFSGLPLPSIYKPYYAKNLTSISFEESSNYEGFNYHITSFNEIHNGVGLYSESYVQTIDYINDEIEESTENDTGSTETDTGSTEDNEYEKNTEEEFDVIYFYNKNNEIIKKGSFFDVYNILPNDFATYGFRIDNEYAIIPKYKISECTQNIQLSYTQSGKVEANYNLLNNFSINRNKPLLLSDFLDSTYYNVYTNSIYIKKPLCNSFENDIMYKSLEERFYNIKYNDDISIKENLTILSTPNNIGSLTYTDGKFTKFTPSNGFNLKNELGKNSREMRYYVVNECFYENYIYNKELQIEGTLPFINLMGEKHSDGCSNAEYYDLFPNKVCFYETVKGDNTKFIWVSKPEEYLIPFFDMYPSIKAMEATTTTGEYGGSYSDTDVIGETYRYNKKAPIALELKLNENDIVVSNHYFKLKKSGADEYRYADTPPEGCKRFYLIGVKSRLCELDDKNYKSELPYDPETPYNPKTTPIGGNKIIQHTNSDTILVCYGIVYDK